MKATPFIMRHAMSWTGKDLIDLGYEPGKHFAEMLAVANTMDGNAFHSQIVAAMDEIYRAQAPEAVETIPLKTTGGYDAFFDYNTDNEFELANVKGVFDTMDQVVRTPTVVDAAVMPDACPAGPLGTIPVGGVVVIKNAIHPGMHSSDICCSMFLTELDQDRDVGEVLDAVQARSHFGAGGRKDFALNNDLLKTAASNNKFLGDKKTLAAMDEHFGTQGDGNHFFFVGRSKKTGRMTFVTHHGSRKPGALLYKAGMKVAEAHRAKYSPETLKQNAWIPADSEDGVAYWEALQIIREWTKLNHTAIHNAVMAELGLTGRNITDRFWNEHNFVFKRGDLFFHAKGSTPVSNEAYDADPLGRTIIPLNMGEPILIVRDHEENEWGFAPHGAGRNMSRTAFNKLNAGKTVEQIMEEQVGHIDARFYSGKPDPSELPGAYKNADEIRRQIRQFKLAVEVDTIEPLGSMMAGEQDQPWRNK